GGPRLDPWSQVDEDLLRQLPAPVVYRPANRHPDVARRLGEILAGVAGDDVEMAVLRNVVPALGGAVELSHPTGDVLNLSGRHLAASQPLGERRVVRQAD